MVKMRYAFGAAATLLLLGGALGAGRLSATWMGRQPDGSFIVSSGRRIEPGAIAFDGRPIDLALHPSGEFFAVLNQRSVFLADRGGVISGSTAELAEGAGYRGAVWTPDGTRLYVSISDGSIQELKQDGKKLLLGARLLPAPPGVQENARPGGMAI